MASNHELFWQADSFAVVGHSSKRKFPVLTYQGLKRSGRKVFPVDPDAGEIEDDKAYPDIAALPEPVGAVVLEVPKEETAAWVAKVAEAGIKDVWIHMNSETPEALDLAQEKGINARYGTCAVMYVTPGFTFHSIHKFFRRMSGKY